MKTITNMICTMIIVIAIAFSAITAVVMLDMNSGYTSPVEVKITGLVIDETGVSPKFEAFQDPAKSLGTAIYTQYYAPVLEEIGLI